MYLRPLRGVPPTQMVAQSLSVPAPTDGWNARDNITEMRPTYALTMENIFPADDRLDLRKGFESHATGLGDNVETLMAYSGGATDELKAIAGGELFDVSTAGAVGTAEVSSLTNSRWQHVNFETSGGNFLVMANGADSVRNYNGTNWTTPTINNVTSANLIHVNVFKERLFFVEKNTLNCWYLPVNSIAGDAAKLTMGAVAKRGGYLMAMGSWTFDGGAGVDDYAVFITSKGEAIVYQGTDPSSASTWALVGVYEIGAPIGRRCIFKVAGELVIITQDGFQLLSAALSNSRAQTNRSYSDRIRKKVRESSRMYGGNFGWQAILYPRGGMGIFNIPTSENSKAEQYVVNTNTKAWCKFTGMNANCWEVFNDELYFGGSATVYKADTGKADNGADIVGTLETAFSYLGSKRYNKRVSMIRPIITTNGSSPGVSVAINADYERNQPVTTPSFSGTGGTPWGSPWGSPWSQSDVVIDDWLGVGAYGRAFSAKFKLSSSAVNVSLNSIDWLFDVGGVI